VTDENKNKLASNLQRLIKKQGMSQKELAVRMGASEASVSRYLHGKRVPSIQALYYLAICLGTTMDEIMTGIGRCELHGINR